MIVGAAWDGDDLSAREGRDGARVIGPRLGVLVHGIATLQYHRRDVVQRQFVGDQHPHRPTADHDDVIHLHNSSHTEIHWQNGRSPQSGS